MKTKYVKVPVSERLPEKEGFYDCQISGKTGKRYIDAARLLPIYINY